MSKLFHRFMIIMSVLFTILITVILVILPYLLFQPGLDFEVRGMIVLIWICMMWIYKYAIGIMLLGIDTWNL